MERRIGVVRNFFHDRGFGFIRVLDNGKPARVDNSVPDVFLHVKELKHSSIDKAESGDTLEFDVTEFPKGLVASKVALYEKQTSPGQFCMSLSRPFRMGRLTNQVLFVGQYVRTVPLAGRPSLIRCKDDKRQSSP